MEQQPAYDQCGEEGEAIIIEPVYFEKRMWLRRYVDPKKMAKYSFYGSFAAVLFIFYVKLMSHPLLAFLYTVGTTVILSYSTILDSGYLL